MKHIPITHVERKEMIEALNKALARATRLGAKNGAAIIILTDESGTPLMIHQLTMGKPISGDGDALSNHYALANATLAYALRTKTPFRMKGSVEDKTPLLGECDLPGYGFVEMKEGQLVFAIHADVVDQVDSVIDTMRDYLTKALSI